MEECCNILQSSLTDEKTTEELQCKDKLIGSQIDFNENMKNVKTTTTNICRRITAEEANKFNLGTDSKELPEFDRCGKQFRYESAPPYLKTQFLNTGISLELSKYKTIYDENYNLAKADMSIQSKHDTKNPDNGNKGELTCRQQEQFLNCDLTLSDDIMNTNCENISSNTASFSNENSFQSVQRNSNQLQTTDKTENTYKENNDSICFNEMTSSTTYCINTITDYQSTCKEKTDGNHVQINEMANHATHKAVNSCQAVLKISTEKNLSKLDHNIFQTKHECLFKENIESLTNQNCYSSYLNNLKNGTTEEATSAKSIYNSLPAKNVGNLEATVVLFSQEINNEAQPYPLLTTGSVFNACKNHICSSLNKEERNNVFQVEEVYKSNINDIISKDVNISDITHAVNISTTNTAIGNNELVVAIKTLYSKNHICNSMPKNTHCNGVLYKENSIPVATSTKRAFNASVALAIKNIRTNNKKAYNFSQNDSFAGSSKNDLLLCTKTKGSIQELSIENLSNKLEILPNNSTSLDKYGSLNNLFNNTSEASPPVMKNDNITNVSGMDPITTFIKQDIPVEHNELISLNCDSDISKSLCNTFQSSNELIECITKQDQKLSLISLLNDTEVLEHTCLSIHTYGTQNNANFEQSNILCMSHLEENLLDTQLDDILLKNEDKCLQNNMCSLESITSHLADLSTLNNSDSYSFIEQNTEKGLLKNSASQEICKATSIHLTSEHKTNETENVQSVFDIQISKYLSPKSEMLFNCKMDIWDDIAWEKTHTKHALYHGHQIIPPMETIASGPFTISLVERLQQLNFQEPTCIQRLVWPAVFRGHNVVAIAPSSSGKSLAYLLPIISQLINQEHYSECVGNDGPLAVILCSNWKNAQAIYNQCQLLLQNHYITVNVVYGRECEKSQKLALLNGCKILIITPPCYLRLHKEDKRIINMDHCCHLIFDDADKIINKFLIDVSEIMKEFVDAVCCHNESFLPNQIILCSEHWNKQISSFVYNCIPNPLVIMISFDEAAIYAQVPTFCHTHPVSNPSKLLKLISTCETKWTVICTCYVETVMQVYELLFPVAPKTLVAHGNLTRQELNKVSCQWKQYSQNAKSVILVCTDDVILQLDIKNANCLIHYDLPKLPNFQFGLRYSLMVNNFCTLEETFSGNVSDCISHIFINKNCQIHSNSLLKFLKQLPCKIPDMLTSFAEIFKEEKEYKNVHICHRLKAYGFCQFHQTCCYRHRIDQILDCVTYVPRYGSVKLFITNVIDATCYYARIMEHNDSSCTLNPVSYLSISLKMSEYYSIATNCIHPTEIKVHALYGLQKAETTFHRVWVISISNYDTMDNPQNVFIHYVDDGWREEISAKKLLVLPPDFLKFPAQAIEVYACSVQPSDKCFDWTPQANMFIHNIINGKEVEGKVVLGVHNTLWLDPIVYYVQTKISNVTIVQAVISDIIIKKEFGIKNADHLPKLYSACDGTIKFPETQTNSEMWEQQHAFLELNKFHDVYIYSIHSPGFFFVQRTDFIECMDSISDKLNEMIKKGKLKKPKRIVKDMICAAPFSGENSWFRATVNHIDIDNDQVDLFFVDYGDTGIVKTEDIYCMPSELLLLPFQAIECSLAGILPYDSTWTSEAGKLLSDLSSSETTTTKMIVKALKNESSHFRRGKHYIIQLWNTSSDLDINVSDELVKQGMALPCDLPYTSKNNDDKMIANESEIEELLFKDKNCKNAFLTAVICGHINEKIDELIAKINNKNECHSLPSDSMDNSLSRITDNSVKNLVPKVQWNQTDRTISIQILVKNVTKYEINIVGLHFCFMTTINEYIYQFEEELFDLVQSETCNAKITDTSIVFTFEKEEIGKQWPQLTKTANENIKMMEMNDKKNIQENIYNEISNEIPVIKWDPQDIFPYDPLDEYEKENLSEDDVPWDQVCLPLDPYDMLCWD